MKYILIALLGLSLIGCATTKSNQEEPDLVITEDDQSIDAYLALFKIEAEKRGVPVQYPFNLRIRIAEGLIPLTGAEGICRPSADKLVIMLDKRLWDNATHLVREQLIFHELGHCYIGFPHDNETDAQNRRLSIMHETGVNPEAYAGNREYFLDRFFGKARMQFQQMMMFLQNIQQPSPEGETPNLLDIIENPGPQDPGAELEEELNNKTNL